MTAKTPMAKLAMVTPDPSHVCRPRICGRQITRKDAPCFPDP